MSSAAKKPNSSSLNVDLLRIVGVKNDQPLAGVLDRLFRAMRALAPEGDLLIGQVASFAEQIEVHSGSGIFQSLVGKSIATDGCLQVVLEQSEAVHYVSDEELGAALTHAHVPAGNAVAFRIDLGGEAAAIALYFQPQSTGDLEPARVAGLCAVAELAQLAAGANDLGLDFEAQALHLESMRSELDEVREFYRQFSLAIHQCFWVLDTESGRPLVVSENFERVWGAERRILETGLTGFMANVAIEDKDRVLSEFHEALGAELETELRVQLPDGELRWIWLRAYPVRNSASRMVLIADDVTEKKVTEELARNREAELVSRARSLAVGDLANGVAHEINNPLMIILGNAAEIQRSLEGGGGDTARLLEAAEKIQRTSMRVAEIIVSLKSLSRPEKAALTRSSVAKVLRDLRDMSSERFKSHGVRLEIREMPESVTAEMNVTLISQALLNLLNNAFDAVQREKDKWVQVDWVEDDESIFLYVSDSGSGIPIKNRGRIFDPFFTTKEPGKGTGLGLSLATTIAAQHQGVLRLDTFHLHTRFVLQLPKDQGTGGK